MSETTAQIYRSTPRQIRKHVIDCIAAGLVPFVQSSPGMGKSTIMRSIAKEYRLKLIDHRISTSAPEDATGLPRFREDGSAEFAPFTEIFPLEGMNLPGVEFKNGKWTEPTHDGWMLFLDELNSGTKGTMAAFYKVLLDRMTGQKKLHPNVCITAAGNLMTDRAITNALSTALQSRVVHLEMEISQEEWLYDVGLKENYDSRIIGFLSQYPSKLMDFRPDHQEKTFCCPRTWEFMNRLIKDQEVTDEKTPLYAGTITSGVAVEFVQFTKVYQNLVTIGQILSNPQTCPVPHDNSLKWATISHMMEKVTEQNFGDLCTYANRFDLSFRILFYRSVLVRNSGLRQHPDFIHAMSELSRYLHG